MGRGRADHAQRIRKSHTSRTREHGETRPFVLVSLIFIPRQACTIDIMCDEQPGAVKDIPVSCRGDHEEGRCGALG